MGVVAVLAVLSLIGIVSLRGVGGGKYASLLVADFGSEPKNFSGNRYEYEGRIDRQLGFNEGVGRVILTKSVADEAPVPLFVASTHDRLLRQKDKRAIVNDRFRFAAALAMDGARNEKFLEIMNCIQPAFSLKRGYRSRWI